MTTLSRNERFTSLQNLGKVMTFLRKGGTAKLGKAVNGEHIELGSAIEQLPGEYVVVVPRDGVSQFYWHATALEHLKEQMRVTVQDNLVTLTK